MLPDGVLIFEEFFGERFVDHGYIAGCRGVLVGDRTPHRHIGADGIEEIRRDTRKPRARIFLGRWFRTALVADAIVPTVPRHGSVEGRGHHSHAADLA